MDVTEEGCEMTTTRELKRFRSIVVLMIYFLVGLHAVRRAIFESLRPPDIAVGVALQVFLTTFCIVDSKCRGKPMLHSFYWIIFFTCPFSVAIYWVWTRGLKGIVSGTLVALTFVIVSAIAFVVTGYLIGREPWLP